MTRYVARISDRDGRPLYRSPAMASREEAAADAFAARPKARECSTGKAIEMDGTWRETHFDIRFHRRNEIAAAWHRHAATTEDQENERHEDGGTSDRRHAVA
jgi:hypothetical protein